MRCSQWVRGCGRRVLGHAVEGSRSRPLRARRLSTRILATSQQPRVDSLAVCPLFIRYRPKTCAGRLYTRHDQLSRCLTPDAPAAPRMQSPPGLAARALPAPLTPA